jgi:hypothetical protein
LCLVIGQEQSQEERGTSQQTAVEVEESKMSHAVVVVRSIPLTSLLRGGEF